LISQKTLPSAMADPHQLQQVFLNLVNNAVDAILEGSADGDLWVHTAHNGGKFLVEFVDSGPGVKDASRVFDPFYTTKPVGKGHRPRTQHLLRNHYRARRTNPRA
jgi:two-component system NtrC family sensor kinase